MAKITAKSYDILVQEEESILSNLLSSYKSPVLVLVDENTQTHCLPIFQKILGDFPICEIKSGEEYKSLETCKLVWDAMLSNKLDRQSLLVNLGGGVIGDLGGFCASTYMRGVDFIQIPTTLLSQVDASVGGKLGVDRQGLKNMIGVFANPQMVWVNLDLLNTLPEQQLVSGFAEVVKHGLIADIDLWNQLSKISKVSEVDDWSRIISRSIDIKNRVVMEDPFEKGLRKILNHGHTIGHAIETLSFKSETPLLHGHAIAAGMIMENFISYKRGNLQYSSFLDITEYILKIFGKATLSFPNEISEVVVHDKKNRGGMLRFSLIPEIGKCEYDCEVSMDEVNAAIAHYQSL